MPPFYVEPNNGSGNTPVVGLIDDASFKPLTGGGAAAYPNNKSAAFLRTVNTYYPSASDATNYARLSALFADVQAGTSYYRELRILGTCPVSQPLGLPDGFTLYGNKGSSRILSSVVNTGNPNDSVIDIVNGGADLGATTVNAVNVINTSVIKAASVAGGSLPVGTWAGHYKAHPTYILVRDNVSGSGFRGNTYQVGSVDGANNVTLTRVVKYQFGVGDAIRVVSRVPNNIIIEGLSIGGTGARYIEIVGTRNCLVREVILDCYDGVPADIWSSFDTFGYENEWRDCQLIGGGGGTDGFVHETQDDSRTTRCDVEEVAGTAVNLFDCVSCMIDDCTGNRCLGGVNFTADGNLLGCVDCVINRGSYYGNSVGIQIATGSKNCKAIGVVSRANGSNVLIGSAGSTTSGISLIGIVARDATIVGCAITNSSTDVKLFDIDTSNSKIGINVNAGSDAYINGFTHTGTTDAFDNGWTLITAGTTQIQNFKIAPTSIINVVKVLGGRLTMRGGTITGGNGSNLILSSAACVIVLSDTVLTVAGGGTGIFLAAGSSCRVGPGVDTSGCSIEYGGATNFSRASLVLNGATPVAVTFPDIKAKDKVLLTKTADGGTPSGKTPIVVITPGVGFTATGIALDTSSFDYEIL